MRVAIMLAGLWTMKPKISQAQSPTVGSEGEAQDPTLGLAMGQSPGEHVAGGFWKFAGLRFGSHGVVGNGGMRLRNMNMRPGRERRKREGAIEHSMCGRGAVCGESFRRNDPLV